MISCSDWRLYVVIDRRALGQRPLGDVASAAIAGGADVIQFRDKTSSAVERAEGAKTLLAMTRAAGIPLIINDDVEVARAIGAEGVHLGQDDQAVAAARRIIGRSCLIGKSTHSVDQALAAAEEGADYIGVGPIFPTPTKPTYASVGTILIGQVSARVKIPCVCIGGIEPGDLQEVLEAGATCVAVVRAVCCAPDPESATRDLKRTLTDFVRPIPTPRL